jgi:hypothetical protein
MPVSSASEEPEGGRTKRRGWVPRPGKYVAERMPPPSSCRRHGAQLLGIQRRRFGFPCAFVRDVIAVSSILQAASGSDATQGAGRGALGAAAKSEPATGGGFGSFLNGYLADGDGAGDTPEPKRQIPGDRRPDNDLAAPAGMPVPVAAAPVSDGSSASPRLAPIPQRAAGPFVWDPALPEDGLTPDGDGAKGGREGGLAPDDTQELAFAARLLAPDSAPSGAAAAAVSASFAAGPEDGTVPTDESEPAQPKNAEVSGASRGAHTSIPGDWQSELRSAAVPGTADSSSSAQGEGRSPADRRNADAFATIAAIAAIAAKGVALSTERTAADRETAAPAPTDMQSAWNGAAPAPADSEAQPAVTAQAASQAGEVAAEPPEAPAQPASRNVSLHLDDGGSGVDIRMAERAGEIRVTVHTSDRDLADTLRADLPDLVGKLRQSGFQAETWHPNAASQADVGRRGGSDGAPREHSPDGRGDGRQRQPQQQQPKNQTRWDGEWKSSLDPAQELHI